jgi:hypothetical protein
MTYEIRLGGHLDDHWSDWLDGMTITREAEGTTTLRGEVADQAQLHGLLAKVRDLGAPLISLERLPGRQAPPRPHVQRR